MLPVCYIDEPLDNEIIVIKKYNENSKNWSQENYVDSYKKRGNEEYIKFDKWCMHHPLLIKKNGEPARNNGYAILKGQTNGHFKKENLHVTEKEYENGEIIYNEIAELGKIFGLEYGSFWIQKLTPKWYTKRKLHSFNIWLKELKKSKYKKMPKQTSDDWLHILSIAHINIDEVKDKQQQELAFAAAASI